MSDFLGYDSFGNASPVAWFGQACLAQLELDPKAVLSIMNLTLSSAMSNRRLLEQTIVRDRYAMSIAPDVVQHLLGSGERPLGVDHPFGLAQGSQV